MHVHCIYRYIALKLDQIAKMIINYIKLHFKFMYNAQCIEIELNCTDDQAQCSSIILHFICMYIVNCTLHWNWIELHRWSGSVLSVQCTFHWNWIEVQRWTGSILIDYIFFACKLFVVHCIDIELNCTNEQAQCSSAAFQIKCKDRFCALNSLWNSYKCNSLCKPYITTPYFKICKI